MRPAELFIVEDLKSPRQKPNLMAALVGGTLLTGSALTKGCGFKVSFTSALRLPLALFLTPGFKRAEPGLTMILRDACTKGWQAVGLGGLAGRGRKPSVALTVEGEQLEGLGRGVLCLTAQGFFSWIDAKCVIRKETYRVG